MTTRLALTIGDPTGIGPEITVKALQRLNEFPDIAFTVIGSKTTLNQTAQALGLLLPTDERISYHAIEDEKPGTVAYQSINTAVRLIKAGEATALVTGPINKKNLHDADHNFAGHTEILDKLAIELWPEAKSQAEMLFVHNDFRLLLLTRHIPLSEVPAALAAPGAIAKPLKTLISYLRKQQNIDTPKLVLLGLNPHAGEVGGEEENKFFLPVIKAVNAIGASELVGPVAADGFFRGFDAATPGCDAIVAAYHDQGLIPFKLLAGYAAVNVTIGLPFLRTSVSHGTAEDIVGQNKASEASLIAAIRAAL